MIEIICYILILGYPFLLWKNFSDAGYKSWQAFIPLYNYFIWLKIIQKPFWWFLIWLIPFLNVFMIFLMAVETAKCYGKQKLWEQALSVLVPFVYFPYLGISKKEHFTHPDKQKPFKKTKTREWVDALIFAGVAAFIIRTFMIELYTIPTSSMEKSLLVGDYLFVSKMAYGAKTPNTLLSIPFVHNTMPLTNFTNSYFDKPQLPYHRFPGFGTVKRYGAVVFNYPTGDTVILERRADDYYRVIRHEGRNNIWKHYTVIYRPVDKRENYVKRCVAIAGDTILYSQQKLYVNGKQMKDPKGMQQFYSITTEGGLITEKRLHQLGISDEDIALYMHPKRNYLPLTQEMVEKIGKMPNVLSIEKHITDTSIYDADIFPFDTAFHWNVDNFGPLYVPKAGAVIPLTPENMKLYGRIIEVYEGNTVRTENGKIWINGDLSETYTFRMNYYWMMGDNRHNSLDSRYWGFVPEDHVVGKASFIFFSLDKDRTLLDGKIRFNRLFRKANTDDY